MLLLVQGNDEKDYIYFFKKEALTGEEKNYIVTVMELFATCAYNVYKL